MSNLTKEEIIGFALTMMQEHDLRIGLMWYESDTCLGAAWFHEDGTPEILGLSTVIIGSDEYDALDVVAHEFAHFVARTKDHNDNWIAACAITGALPRRYYDD